MTCTKVLESGLVPKDVERLPRKNCAIRNADQSSVILENMSLILIVKNIFLLSIQFGQGED